VINQAYKDELVRLISEIEAFMADNGSIYSDWYVGITEDVKKRLFRYHKVKDTYITLKTPSVDMARIIERYFIQERKTDGGNNDNFKSNVYLYAYRKQDYTKENG